MAIGGIVFDSEPAAYAGVRKRGAVAECEPRFVGRESVAAGDFAGDCKSRRTCWRAASGTPSHRITAFGIRINPAVSHSAHAYDDAARHSGIHGKHVGRPQF